MACVENTQLLEQIVITVIEPFNTSYNRCAIRKL